MKNKNMFFKALFLFSSIYPMSMTSISYASDDCTVVPDVPVTKINFPGRQVCDLSDKKQMKGDPTGCDASKVYSVLKDLPADCSFEYVLSKGGGFTIIGTCTNLGCTYKEIER